MSGKKSRLLFLLQFIIVTVIVLISYKSYADKDKHSRSGDNDRGMPNFIFILADDLGWGDLGVYGHRTIRTPNLDRMAMKGVLFTQFYVNSPICCPSRFAFMTGIFPARKGVLSAFHRESYENQELEMPGYLDPAYMTISRLLKKAGYATAHYGKWNLGSSSDAPEPSAYGFDDSYVRNGNGPGWHTKKRRHFQPVSSGLIIGRGIKFIENNRDKPFYINLWLTDPHLPLAPTKKQIEPYNHLKLEKKARDYYAVVTNMDLQIGRLLKRLEELGIDRKTVVFFSSDNGPAYLAKGSAGPFRGLKGSLYEGGLRVPFIVHWPGKSPAGKINDTTVISAVDFLPTLAGLAHIKLPGNIEIDGEDMSRAIMGKPVNRTKPLLWFNPFRQPGYQREGEIIHLSPVLAVREGNWKLLMNNDRSRQELYNIPDNPAELNNVAAIYPDIVRDLSGKLDDWYRSLPLKRIFNDAGSYDYPWPDYKLYRKLKEESAGK